MPEKPRRSASRATSRVSCRRPGTATRLRAGNGIGHRGLLIDFVFLPSCAELTRPERRRIERTVRSHEFATVAGAPPAVRIGKIAEKREEAACGSRSTIRSQRRPVDDRRGGPGRHAAGADRDRRGQDASRGADRAGRGDPHRDPAVHDAGWAGDPRRVPRRADRLFPDRLDRAQRHLHVPADRRDRRLRDPAAGDRRRHGRPAPAIAADRVLRSARSSRARPASARRSR